MVRAAPSSQLDAIHTDALLEANVHPLASGMVAIDDLSVGVKTRAKDFLQQHVQTHALLPLSGFVALKALPLWQQAAAELGFSLRYVMILRHPLQSSEPDISQWLIMWASHWLQLIEKTHGQQRFVINQDALAQDLTAELERMQLALAMNQVERQELAGYFIASANVVGRQAVAANSVQAVPYCSAIHDCLLKVAKDGLVFESAEFAAKWQPICADHAKVCPMYAFIDQLLLDQTETEAALRFIRQSLLWRMMSPLRMLDDYLRKRRRLTKIKQKAIPANA